MSYLDLVEAHTKEYKVTLFEKVIMASKRAKALHAGKTPLVDSLHKESYMALEEIRDGKVYLVYRDEDSYDELAFGGGEQEGEE